jgi:hypothetical protein
MSDQQEPEVDVGGRPRKEIDLKQLEAMCAIQCTAEECASVFECSVDTIDRRLKEEGYAGFAEFFKMHSDAGKASLRRMQWKNAQNGNVAMQIWLGKQMLDQKDRTANEHTGRNGGPIETIDLSSLTDEQLEQYGALCQAITGQSSDDSNSAEG